MVRADSIRNWLDEIDRLDRVLDRRAGDSVYGTQSEKHRARQVMEDTVRSLAQSLSVDELVRAMDEGRLYPEEVEYLRSVSRHRPTPMPSVEHEAKREHER